MAARFSGRLVECPNRRAADVTRAIGIIARAKVERSERFTFLTVSHWPAQARIAAARLAEAAEQREMQSRKERSISILKAEGVPYIDHLPVIEAEAGSTRRTTEDVALRAIPLAWAVHNAQLKSRRIPARLNADFVMERHNALNWWIGHGGQSWDDVPTDT